MLWRQLQIIENFVYRLHSDILRWNTKIVAFREEKRSVNNGEQTIEHQPN